MIVHVRWYAVLYPAEAIQNTNAAMRREECKTESDALLLCQQWRGEYPGKRVVIRREVEVIEAQEILPL